MFELHDKVWYSVQDTLFFEDLFTYKTINTTKQVTYYNDVIAFDIETSSFNEDVEEDYRDDQVYK